MRRGLALAPVVVVLTAVAEIAVFVAVVHAIGAGWALLLLAVSSVAGLVLLRREGIRAWRRFRAAAAGSPPGPQVTDGLVGLLGALLLAVPGFVTAVLGLVLLVPPTRGLVRRNLERSLERQVSAAVAGDLFGPRRVRVRRGAPVPDDTPDVAAETPLRATPAQPGPAITGEVVEGEIVR
jgi:UPF0716 protein FxsA